MTDLRLEVDWKPQAGARMQAGGGEDAPNALGSKGGGVAVAGTTMPPTWFKGTHSAKPSYHAGSSGDRLPAARYSFTCSGV